MNDTDNIIKEIKNEEVQCDLNEMNEEVVHKERIPILSHIGIGAIKVFCITSLFLISTVLNLIVESGFVTTISIVAALFFTHLLMNWNREYKVVNSISIFSITILTFLFSIFINDKVRLWENVGCAILCANIVILNIFYFTRYELSRKTYFVFATLSLFSLSLMSSDAFANILALCFIVSSTIIQNKFKCDTKLMLIPKIATYLVVFLICIETDDFAILLSHFVFIPFTIAFYLYSKDFRFLNYIYCVLVGILCSEANIYGLGIVAIITAILCILSLKVINKKFFKSIPKFFKKIFVGIWRNAAVRNIIKLIVIAFISQFIILSLDVYVEDTLLIVFLPMIYAVIAMFIGAKSKSKFTCGLGSTLLVVFALILAFYDTYYMEGAIYYIEAILYCIALIFGAVLISKALFKYIDNCNESTEALSHENENCAETNNITQDSVIEIGK